MNEAAVIQYREDDVILRQGEQDRNLYKVLEGNVALYMNYGEPEEYLVGLLTFPSCFGEMTILANEPSYYTVVALDDAKVLRVPESNFESFIQGDHRNAMSIMKTMAHNLALMNVNMNMMIEELKELSRSGGVDELAIRRLVESVTLMGDREEMAPEEPTEPQGQDDDDETELPGHRNYPSVTHPEYRACTYTKEYTCPHCGHRFVGDKICHSKLVPAQSGLRKLRYDLHIFYENFEVEWYDIITCPHCCFSSLERYFTKPTELNRARFEQRLSQSRFAASLKFGGERDINFVFAQHYLALICASGLAESRQLTARFWDNLNWLYRSVGDDLLARSAEQKAIAAYQKVYKTCKLEPLQKQRLCMKVAGTLYLLDRLEEAQEWAVEARNYLMEQVGKTGQVDLAQLLLQEIREKLEEQQPQSGCD